MKPTFDYRKMEAELAEDEAIGKTRPVLLTQREIALLLAKRCKKPRQEGDKT